MPENNENSLITESSNETTDAQTSPKIISHRTIEIDGIKIFYREAGATDAPVLVMPHGYPCSSFQYRNLMPKLADSWRLIAPDFPAFGYSDFPSKSEFDYSFAGYTEFLEKFADALSLSKFALYLHDYGSQIGLRLATKRPERITALIIQNGDAYEETLGPKYKALKDYWVYPTEFLGTAG